MTAASASTSFKRLAAQVHPVRTTARCHLLPTIGIKQNLGTVLPTALSAQLF
jgi:hypothetical protein